LAKPTKYTREESREDLTTNSSRIYKIICTPNFLNEARQLSKKYPNIKDDYLSLKDVLKKNPDQGDDLGYGLRKIRMIISDKGQGKSGSARVMIQIRMIDGVVYVLSTYDKAEYDTIITDTLKKQLRKEEEKERQQAKRNAKRKRK